MTDHFPRQQTHEMMMMSIITDFEDDDDHDRQKILLILGINLCFHALTLTRPRKYICQAQKICLSTRPLGGVIKHLLRDLTGVNAMKQRCVMVILAFYLIPTH